MTVTILPGQTGIDAATRHDPRLIVGAGFRFVVRYISNRISWKVLSPAERDELLAAGLGLVLVFETSSTATGGGGVQGAKDGHAAAQAAYGLGYPSACAILAAVDTDDHAPLLAVEEAYLRAFARACAPYPMGVYGGTLIIEKVADVCALGWKANAAYWSPTPSSNVHVRQLAQDSAHGWDPNVCVKPFVAWSRATVPVPVPPIQTTPIPPTPPEDPDMAAKLIKADDGDNAIFAVQGLEAVWCESRLQIAAGQKLGTIVGTNGGGEVTTPRASLKALTLVGPAPSYAGMPTPPPHTTTAADFARQVT